MRRAKNHFHTKRRDTVKRLFEGKSYGFFVTLALLVLSVVTAIVYAVSYSNYERYMSNGAVVALIIGTVLSVLLIVFKQFQLSAAAVALGGFVAMLLFIEKIYNYVVVVLVGIDLSTFSAEFITCSALFGVLLVGGIVDIFLKQTKEEQ